MSARPLFAWIFAFLIVSSLVSAHDPAVGRIDNPPFPIEARPINSSSVIDACGVASFAFWLTNPGSYDETLDLDADPSFDTAYFSENPVVLAPGQSKSVTLFVAPPCEVYGTWNVELLARNRENMREVRTLVGELEVSSDGMVEIAKGIERVRIDYNRSGTNIPITNIGAIDANYGLSVVGPSWVSIKPQNVSLPNGESGVVMLVTSPATTVEKGAYRATLFAKSRETSVEYGKVVQIVLEPFTAEELRWNALKPWLILALVLLLVLLVLLILLIWWLIRTRDARRKRAAERSAAKEVSRSERFESDKERWASRVKMWFKRQFEKEYVFIRKTDGSIVRFWPMRLLKLIGVLVVVGLLAFLIWRFWPVLLPYSWIVWIIIALFFLSIILAWVWRRIALRRWMARFTSRELDDINQQARDELEEEFVLADRAALLAAKRQKRWIPSALLWIACLIAILFAVASWKWSWWLADWFIYAFAIFMALAALFAILAVVVYRRCRSRYAYKMIPVMEAGELYSMQTGWRDGVTEVGVRSKVDKEGVVLSCRRHDDNPVFVEPDGVSYQFVEVRASGLSDKEVDEAFVKFKMNRDWLSDCRCGDRDVALMRYDPVKSRWVRSDDFQILGSDGKSNGYSASSSGLGYFAIVAKPKKGALDEEKAKESPKPGFFARWFDGKDDDASDSRSIADEIAARKAAREAARLAAKEEERRRLEEERRRIEMEALLAAQDKPKRRWWRWLLWLLLILLLLTAVFAIMFWIDPSLMPPWLAAALGVSQADPVAPPPVNETPVNNAPTRVGIPDQVWLRNTPHVMDLSRWFTDPDVGDVLTFAHTPMGHIFVSYNGSVATLTPEKDWEGTEQTTFTATDNGGLSVQSNSVRMVVQHGQNTPMENTKQFFRDYWMYLVLALFILVVVIVSVVMLKKADEKEDE